MNKAFLLLGLLLLAITSVDAEASEATGEVESVKDPMNPPDPPRPVEVWGCAVWATWSVVFFIYWAVYIVAYKPSGSLGPALCACLMNFGEALYFGANVIYYGERYPWIKYPWSTMIQIFIGGSSIWMLTFYVGDVGRNRFKGGTVYKRLAIVVGIAAVLSACVCACCFTGNAIFVGAFFFVFFEPPQFFLMANAWGAAKSFLPSKNPAFWFAVGFSILFGMHLTSIMYTNVMETSMTAEPLTAIIYFGGQMLGSGILIVGLTKMINAGMFEATTPDPLKVIGFDEAAAALKKAELKRLGIMQVFINPEKVWAYGVPFTLVGYAVSTFCLFVLTPDFDLKKDPVFHLYGTLHPCILLDYLPGTIFAQIFLGLGMVIQDYSVLAVAYRSAVYGDGFFFCLNAFTVGLFWIFNSIFVLVFTFNPTVTNVFLHSLPYMIMNVMNSIFMFSMIVIMCKWPALNNVRYSVASGTFYFIAAGLYGTYFMSGKLMSDAGMNLVDGNTREQTEEALLEKELDFNPMPFSFSLMGQAFLMLYGLLSPLKHRPLTCILKVQDNEGSINRAEAQRVREIQSFKDPQLEKINSNIGLSLRCRIPLTLASFLIMIFYLFAIVFDKRIHGEGSFKEGDHHEVLRRLPGSAIAAVSWVFVAHFLLAHVVLVLMYEYQTFSKVMFGLTAFIGAVLIIAATAAIAGTIPNLPDWFKGLEFFLITFSLWLLINLPRFRKATKTPLMWAEISCAFAAATVGIIMCFVDTQTLDFLWMALVLGYCLADSQGCTVTLADMRVATLTDLMVEDAEGKLVLPQHVVDTIDIGKFQLGEMEEEDSEMAMACCVGNEDSSEFSEDL